MKILKTIDIMEQVAPEISNKPNTRREALQSLAQFGSKVAVASLPFALGAMFNKSYATGVFSHFTQDMLNLENLQTALYTQGLAKVQVQAGDSALLEKICMQAMNHAMFWKNTIIANNNTPSPEKQYDFTASGLFPNVFNNYKSFLEVAQLLKDASVTYYKLYLALASAKYGAMDNYSRKDVLSFAFVEARHSAYLRLLRKQYNYFNIQPWITGGNDTGISAADPVYIDESITKQQVGPVEDQHRPNIQIIGINGHTEIDTIAATQAFDEANDSAINFISLFYKA